MYLFNGMQGEIMHRYMYCHPWRLLPMQHYICVCNKWASPEENRLPQPRFIL